jgi:tyrosinase
MKDMPFEHSVEELLMDIHPGGFEVFKHISQRDLIPLLSVLSLRPRKNQKFLKQSEKDLFNKAIKEAIDDGIYGDLADEHLLMTEYRMHSHTGPIGMLRFLPWHRIYLYKMELALQRFVPGIRIPYWMWERDHELLTWVHLPSGVTRGPDTKEKLPEDSDVLAAYSSTTYTEFTSSLETMHNTVHRWVDGTMRRPGSPRDPMFWLHHANVDRIWTIWNSFLRDWGKESEYLPILPSPDDVMDPWKEFTVKHTSDTNRLGYYYQGRS